MTIAAMKQALECLESLAAEPPGVRALHLDAVVIQNLRAAIEQAETAEPVAEVWRSRNKATENGLSNGITEMLPMGTKLYTHPAPVPAGWQLVPVEPTKAMLSAGWGNDHLYADLYKAMLQAAPKPVKPTDDRSHDVKHSVKVSKRQTLGN